MLTLKQCCATNLPRTSLASSFNNMYDIVRADTPGLVEQAYRLRYQVYCKEQGYEDADRFVDGCEHDEYDNRSVHSLLLDRSSCTFVGTVRIILPLEHIQGNSLPIHNLSINHVLTSSNSQLQRAAEISRFSMSKLFMRKAETLRRSGMMTPHPVPGDCSEKQLLMSHMTLGLVKAILEMSVERGIGDLFAVMEPALIRLLSRFSIYFKPIGPLVDYHGMRQPCHVNIYALEERVHKERRDVWEMLTDEGRLLRTPPNLTNYCS